MSRNKFPPIIETERLLIRAPSVSDAPAVNAAIRESFEALHRWMKWAAELPSLEETQAYSKKAEENFLAGEDFPVRAFLKNTGEFVLASGLHPRDWEVPKFEIGYWCCTSLQGCGYVTEAVRALTRVGFEQMGANRIEIRCDPRNARSRHVAERAGYKLEAELRHEQVGPDGALRNTLIYALFPDMYRSSAVVLRNDG